MKRRKGWGWGVGRVARKRPEIERKNEKGVGGRLGVDPGSPHPSRKTSFTKPPNTPIARQNFALPASVKQVSDLFHRR